MKIPSISESEYRFCLILWREEPISSSDLAKICEKELGWKRTTTYTVVKRLSSRKIVEVENGLVKALISKENVQSREMDYMFHNKFEGSIPSFLNAFAKLDTIKEEDILQIEEMIKKMRDGKNE